MADLIASAAAALPDRDQIFFNLAYRHQLDIVEIAETLGISHDSAERTAQRVSRDLDLSLANLCLIKRTLSDVYECTDLRTLLEDWDGEFTTLTRKRIARHVESCRGCSDERDQLRVRAAAFRIYPAFDNAPDWLRERTLARIRLDQSTGSSR